MNQTTVVSFLLLGFQNIQLVNTLLFVLSLSDILLTTKITPNLLWLLVSGGNKIFVSGCFTQFFFYCAAIECLLLTAMSYNRYVAICNPLRYGSIMNFKLCLFMSLYSWGLAFMVGLIFSLLVSQLQFCAPYILDYIYIIFVIFIHFLSFLAQTIKFCSSTDLLAQRSIYMFR
ncbi:hypothetical protein XELAEV_18019464mg [Xenopus laevis]|uniref:G-protein coupled receptors family 1 profile domain-containing protein n=1 Tax=Xenopus laevis TaxID=8355 RepID=A0A974DFR6_XENLA|nr:hypothetical protein XELAEV_18019464mg [Xenopus laevis]